MLKMKSIEESATCRLSFGLWFFFQILFELGGAKTEKPKHSSLQTIRKLKQFIFVCIFFSFLRSFILLYHTFRLLGQELY